MKSSNKLSSRRKYARVEKGKKYEEMGEVISKTKRQKQSGRKMRSERKKQNQGKELHMHIH